jgi:hypothetical protein
MAIKNIKASTVSKSMTSRQTWPVDPAPYFATARAGSHLAILTDADKTYYEIVEPADGQLLNIHAVGCYIAGVLDDRVAFHRSYLLFDISSLISVVDTTLYMYNIAQAGGAWDRPTSAYCGVTATTCSNPVVTGDWASVTDTELTGAVEAGFGGWKTALLNADGLTYLANSIPSGWLKLAIRHHNYDIPDFNPPDLFHNQLYLFYNTNEAGKEPYIRVNGTFVMKGGGNSSKLLAIKAI